MTKYNLTCIGCPMGCQLEVEKIDKEKISVTGHTCRRGETYARKEITNPTRIVTTTVRIESEPDKVLSVKTEYDIPKTKILECIQALKDVCIRKPIYIGDIVVGDIAKTGVNVIATKTIE